LHLLTSYPPSNLNRDDLGRPKTAIFGGTQRLRVSSQSLKRAWRESAPFEAAVGAANKGVRTLHVAYERAYEPLVRKGIAEDKALAAASAIRNAFEKGKDGEKEEKAEKPAKKKPDPREQLKTSQLIFVSPRQLSVIDDLVKLVASGEKLDAAVVKEKLLTNEGLGADVSLFGRMMSANQHYSAEAAAQVAHAITVHKVTVEDDYFSAVDDLNEDAEDAGAGHIGTVEFAAGVFYLYVCIDRELLLENLGGDEALARSAIRGLVEAACTVSPKGKKATFGSMSRASYGLIEKGSQQPRNLSVAFLKAVREEDLLEAAILRLRTTRDQMDAVYGPCADARQEFEQGGSAGSYASFLDFAST
jgi:CRISPR system Cascade subunit CasC